MNYDAKQHHRRSIRLPGYDYSQPGAYFVTLCTHQGEPLFGRIADGGVHLSAAGLMVAAWWVELSRKYPWVTPDELVVMPDHLHGIIFIAARVVGEDPGAQSATVPTRVVTLGEMVAWLETMTTTAYIRGVKEDGWPSFAGRLWQRNYYERVIRGEQELATIRRYVRENPAQWEADRRV